MINENFELKTPLHDQFPREWLDTLGQFSNVEFRNLDHFRYVVGKLTQKEDDKCGVSYANALNDLLQGNSLVSDEEYAEIHNLVKSNLHARGLITDEVYENYRYTTDGTKVEVDIAKYAAGEPDCVISPAVEYVDYFYELYINVSYDYRITNEFIFKNIVKLLSTIEELERQHIFIKVTLVFPGRWMTHNTDKFASNIFLSIPLFSHKDTKNTHTMSSVVNDRLLRKFCFAVIEDLYGNDIADGYGTPTTLPKTMNVGEEFNEIDFFELVLETAKNS